MKSGKKVLGSKTIQIPRCAKIVAVHKPIHHALGYQLQTSKPVFSVVTIPSGPKSFANTGLYIGFVESAVGISAY